MKGSYDAARSSVAVSRATAKTVCVADVVGGPDFVVMVLVVVAPLLVPASPVRGRPVPTRSRRSPGRARWRF